MSIFILDYKCPTITYWYFVFAGNDRFECLTDNFKVINTKGNVLLSADHKEIVLGVDVLRITGDGGTIFSGSVQTPLVRAESGHDLRFVSFAFISEVIRPIIKTASAHLLFLHINLAFF